MYIELLVFPRALAGQEVPHRTARSTLAKACEAFPLDPRIFARDESGKTLTEIYPGLGENGKALPKPPLVTIRGGKGFFRITGLGLDGVRLVRENAQLICQALSEHYKSPYAFDLKEGDCKVEQLLGFVNAYYVPTMVVMTKVHRWAKLNKPKDDPDRRPITLEDLRPYIVREISEGLLAQCRYMDDSYRDAGRADMATLESELGTDDMLNIEIHEGKPNFQAMRPGDPLKALFVNDLVFTAAVKITGPCYLGRLRSRGHGVVLPRTVQ